METNKVLRQLAIAAACFLILISSLITPVKAFENKGNCGTSVTYSLENGVLTISGNGAMDNYYSGHYAPWYDVRSTITKVIVKNGVTEIGSASFYKCENLRVVQLADSVKVIGEHAFQECVLLTSVKMSKGIKTIEDYAFKKCKSLTGLTLPDGLISLGIESFFDCESLVSVVVPSSVTTLGNSSFAYCTSLIQASVYADLAELSPWTFYGCTALMNVHLGNNIQNVGNKSFHNCDSLTTVSSEKDDVVCGIIKSQIQQDIPNFGNVESVGSTNLETTYKPENGGNTVQKDVVENNDVTISGSVDKNPTNDSLDITVDVVIKDEDGWDKVVDKIVDYEDKKGSYNDDTPIDVNVSIEGKQEVSGDVINDLAGKNVNLTINGDIEVEIPCHKLDKDKKYSGFSLEYTLEKITEASSDVKEAIGESQGYYLKFKDSMDYEITVKIPISRDYARNNASLYKKEDGKWKILQSVQLDNDGNASFYLIGFDTSKYLIGINVGGVSNVLVPEDLYDDYGGLTDEYGNKYVTTGVAKSSWGITYGQFTMILLGVLAVVIVIVGVVMFIMNKRKITLQRIRDEVMNDKNYKKRV